MDVAEAPTLALLALAFVLGFGLKAIAGRVLRRREADPEGARDTATEPRRGAVNPYSPSDHAHLPPVAKAATGGVLVIGVFFGGFALWSATAPLQSAAIAQGSVNLDTYRKTVQHLEGGIVDKIFVQEGQQVAQNDVLIALDDTQARAKMDLLGAQISSSEKQLDLIAEELIIVESLFGQGLTTQTRLLELRRRQVELQGGLTEQMAQLRAARDVIARSQIRAPISGTVVNLQVHTPQGVIGPGDPLLSIVGRDEALVVEARVDPNDIDVIHKDLPAQVRLTPLNARMVPPLPGVVAWVSADSMTEQRSGTVYYLARVRISSEAGELPDDIDLYPGMPAEVMIATGEGTFLDYMIAPLTRSLRRAFREQ